jgi:hypothetical protein
MYSFVTLPLTVDMVLLQTVDMVLLQTVDRCNWGTNVKFSMLVCHQYTLTLSLPN